ncbi:chemotaxis protein CheD [Tranquillimonas alkanivorans]|uniref:chemotaxis protein CheD n=1 Tax=Tranquillimonas alkanivorans TaxID=441119 RepID=UPI001FE1F7A3|nr:chemotaxis protein CheD [Tranquillimonas alkanivorans]
MLVTLLGSCVATCLFDPVARVGGLNHFLLPAGSDNPRQSVRYGAHAMELLINGLLRRGANRHRLKGKLFGGARMVDGLSDIGAANSLFARDFLAKEGIECVGSSLGGVQARKIRFVPTTGAARQMLVERQAVEAVERAPRRPRPPPEDDITLF